MIHVLYADTVHDSYCRALEIKPTRPPSEEAMIFMTVMALLAPMEPLQATRVADPLNTGSWPPGSRVVKIEVAGDRTYTRPHTINIRAQELGLSRSTEELDARVWVATREWADGSQSMSSTDCPAIRTIALSVRELPPVQIAPLTLRIMSGDSIPIPPIIKDGFSTTLTFGTVTEDGSSGEVIIRHGNVYTLWGHNAVGSLISCWGPLWP